MQSPTTVVQEFSGAVALMEFKFGSEKPTVALKRQISTIICI
jgi:hypothetical protein